MTVKKLGVCFVSPRASLRGEIEIGEGTTVLDGAVLRAETKRIILGKECNVQDNCVVHAETRDVVIGEGTTLGHACVLEDCVIGKNSLIGMNATIWLCDVGDDCLIAAGALVLPNTKIPSGSLVIGSPAKVVRSVSEENKAQIKAWREYYAKHYGYAARQ
ncbi:MAG: gamma carbonic anhydrase family protein [Candidatus Norongarragalinales archaeon]